MYKNAETLSTVAAFKRKIVSPDPGQQTPDLLVQCHDIIVKLQDHIQHLEEVALTDELTGAINLRGMRREIAKIHAHYARCEDTTAPVYALIFFDLDKFKEVNDILGHDVGDKVLQDVVSRVEHTLRPDDVLVRKSGDEFFVLLPSTSERLAYMVAKRIKKALDACSKNLSSTYKNAPDIGASISVADFSNVQKYVPDLDDERFMKALDILMYSGKQQGGIIRYSVQENPLTLAV